MIRLVFAVSLLLPQVVSSQPFDVITIDGSKNPEMIPEWAVWTSAFHVIAASHRAGSQGLIEVLDLTAAEGRLLFTEAESQDKRDAACGRRVEELRPLLGTVKDSEINAKIETIQIDCRRQTLRARDRLLEAFRPESRFVLTQFVEEHKAGMQVTISKAELAHYQKPQ